MPPVATADAGIAGNAAPAPTVAPSVPAVRAADPAPVLAQVAGAALAAKDGVTELRLSPEELGSLRIDLRTEGDRVIISLSAERQDTLDLMRRHADRLTEDLRTLGFTRLDLSFGRWSGQGGQGAQDNAPHRTAPAAREPVTADDHHPTAAPAGPVGGLYLRI
jgi:flagellar hook-length control protein FliK